MSIARPASEPTIVFGGGLKFAFLSYGLFSVADVSVKAISTRLSVYEVSFFIAVFSMAVLPFVKAREDSWIGIFAMRRPRLVLFRSLAGTFAGVFSIIALTHVPFAEAYAVIFAAPLIALVLSVVFLGELVGWRRWTSVAIGIAGVLVVLRPGFRGIEPGHVAAIAAAFCVAISIICLRGLGRTERPVAIFGVLTLVNLVVVVPLMLVGGFVMPDSHEWALLVLSGVAAGCGQLLLMAATRRAPANVVAPVQYSQLCWAILYGVLFFAELPDWPTLLGLLVITASGLFLIQRKPADAVAVPGAL